jgi:hypothetical protein
MASDLDICNNALTLLGSGTIASFTESAKAGAVNNLYSTFKLSMLAAHSWRFATYKVQLAQLVAVPTNEWTYGYQLPPDMIAGPFAVFNSDGTGTDPITSFEIFGDKLFTDETEIYIDYRADVDEPKLPPWFVGLLEMGMAARLGAIITDSKKLAEEWNLRAFGSPSDNGRGGWFSTCVVLNASFNPPNVIEDRSLVDARFS